MIKSLRVRNYLYIKDANLSFVSGINALIGESGVGKSVIVNILALPFGKKPAENPIGKWADKAEIEIIFLAQEQEYTLNIVIGSRVGFKLNEKVVSHEKIKDIWSKFLNIHSQGERDYLYYDQLQIFDSFIPDMQSVKSLYESEYAEFELLKEELNVLEKKILTDEQKELYLFQLKEIERVSPVLGEDEEMFIALKQAKNKELFASLVSDLNFLLDGFADSIKQADKKIKDLVSMELFSENLVKKSASIKENLDDIRWELSKVDSPDNEINAQSVESRLNELEKLKSKFKLDLDQIIIKKEHLTESLDEQDFLLAKRDKLMIEMDNQKKELLARAQVLSQKRRDNTVRMEQALKLVFKKLKLEYAEIAVFFSAKQQPSFSGMDDISILIRVNSNTKMVPLTELSGGETSRVLLALKRSLQDSLSYNTYLFDEIDSGVSGEVALKMREVMIEMAQHHQLIVITHQPLIAVGAKKIIKILKNQNNQETLIEIIESESKEQIIQFLAELVSAKPSKEAREYVSSLMEK